jgi:RNA polymerase sigma-70 factor, ECF subfamily
MKRATLVMPVDKPSAKISPVHDKEAAAFPIPAQFEALFLEHWPRVYAVLFRLMGDHAEAEDLALETFMKMYRAYPKQDAAFNLGGWLYRVATNLGLNAIRDRKRRQLYERQAGRVEWLDEQTNGPAELFAAEEQRQLVRKVLGEMPSRQAQLLVLRYAGKPYKEIAAALGVSATSIGPLLVRAEQEFEKRFRAAEQGGR